MIELRADFLRDLGTIADSRLRQLGVVEGHRGDPLEAVRRYLQVERRLVPLCPRTSVWSDTLRARPVDALTPEVHRICGESEAGQDLNHYLSRQVPSAKSDMQQDDWGIVHFHLGGRVPGGGLSKSKSSGPLLFVVHTVDRLFLIDIGDHHSFSDGSIFETLHRNWPELIADGKAPNAAWAETFSDERKELFRKLRLNTVTVTADGTAYNPLGFGQVASGASLQVIRQADWLSSQASGFQRLCSTLAEGIVVEAAKLGARVPDRVLRLRLVTFGERLVAEDYKRRFGVIFNGSDSLTVAVR